ncbi:PDZ domain-containing protein [Massilia sp. MB5]|uniref:S41 family peptidase n=1 Tax=Massilia sp. MB5 TaxID=2919578 RepID=UPI001F10EEBC|nr:S41 family peptidase [Massilia sp. MB5]UMR30491.1 PDZ domain-containing protein [Massilia sp. MB5]
MSILSKLSLAAAALLPLASQALPNTSDTRLLTEPAVSASHIAFIYAGDVWLANPDGSGVRRLTSDVGEKSNPVFSPDGRLLAYSATLDGNTDVYVLPVGGGVPQRLTWHPGPDLVQSFTPDGKAVMFTSPRAAFNNRYRKLFTVPVTGGVEAELEIPNAARAAYSPDGKSIVYNPTSPAFLQWKRYRGGTHSVLWIFNRTSQAVEKIPQPASRANDVDPVWLGDTIYFRSDRDGEFNLYAYDTKTKAVRALTRHTDFPVLNAAAQGRRIVYEQAGYLHALDLDSGTARKLTIGVSSDLGLSRPRWVRGASYIRDASISPSGARVAFEFRGDIVTLPADKGDVRHLTQSPAVHERNPAWSPDGRSLAYFSDESGEYALHVQPQDGKGPVRKFKLSGAGFYERANWSPDSKKIAFIDNAWSLYVLDLASGVQKKIATEPIYGVTKSLSPAWAPDSRWIAYTLNSLSYTRSAYIYSLEQDKSYAVTDGLSDVADPAFDRSGKYLYFFASTNAGPTNNWFSLQNEDNRATSSIWLAVLRQDLPSPLVKESDEEKGAAAKPKDAKDEASSEKKENGKAEEKPAVDPATGRDDPKVKVAPVAPMRIDFDGISTRVVDLPVPVAQLSNLETGAEGQVFFMRESEGKKSLQRFDLKDRKTETVVAELDGYGISADGKKVIYRQKDNWATGSATGKTLAASEGKLRVDAIEVKADPRAEWNQIYHEAWRINRDYFYDPGMHGVNWRQMHDKYAQFLPDLATRSDLNRVIQWLHSELGVGHHRGGGGDSFIESKPVPGGLLGADYEVANGRYRFKKIYGGLNWNPTLRSPLTEPGLNVKVGEYLLAVDGKPLAPPTNLYAPFENSANRTIEITVGPNGDGKGARTITVVPVASEDALRNRDWVEGNIRKVNAATGGRVAYVYVPNTTTLGHTYFKRYFYPQSYKDGVIIDERFNGGGSLADYYIEILQKQEIAWWTMRYGADMKSPSASIQGPRAMLIDETAGSGGDLLPWMFRKNKMGPLIGKRTWGGLVGILGFPVLLDGAFITAPNLAFWTRENGWGVENEGVPPDIEVEQTPADVIAGRDPQLEKAIEVVKAELAKNPPSKPPRPAFPDKSKFIP